MTNSVVFVLFSSEFEHPKLGENFEPRICSYFFEEIDGEMEEIYKLDLIVGRLEVFISREANMWKKDFFT